MGGGGGAGAGAEGGGFGSGDGGDSGSDGDDMGEEGERGLSSPGEEEGVDSEAGEDVVMARRGDSPRRRSPPPYSAVIAPTASAAPVPCAAGWGRGVLDAQFPGRSLPRRAAVPLPARPSRRR